MKLQQAAPNWMIGWLGVLAGSVTGLALGLFFGMNYVRVFMPNAELEAVMPIVIGMGLGVMVGGIAGVPISRLLVGHLGVVPALGLLLVLSLVGMFLIRNSLRSLGF